MIETGTYSEHCQTFKMKRFAKRIMPECRHTKRNFQGRGGFVELEHFDKHFVKNTRKKPRRETFWIFFQDNIKTTFWMENLSQRWSQSRSFFNSAPESVAEYASIYLIISKYPRKCLNKLFWLCQGSEYAKSSYMFERLLKMSRVLHMLGFWI